MNTNLKPDQASGAIQIPDHYQENDSEENKIIYALSQIGEGSAEDVGIKVSELDTSIEPGGFSHMAEPILKNLCERGLINCRNGKDDQGYYFIPEQQ